MRYVTAEEMKRLDRDAIEKELIPAGRLMENAGRAVAAEAAKALKKGSVAVFSGYGNNGGDGFVAARYLIKRSYSVKVFLVGREKPLSPESGANLAALKSLNTEPETISAVEDMDKIGKPDLVIDAIFGIGIKGRLDDFYAKLIDRINSLGSTVISADIPSGLDADTGEPLPVAIKASRTVTMGYPKIGFKNPKAVDYLGKLAVARIYAR